MIEQPLVIQLEEQELSVKAKKITGGTKIITDTFNGFLVVYSKEVDDVTTNRIFTITGQLVGDLPGGVPKHKDIEKEFNDTNNR